MEPMPRRFRCLFSLLFILLYPSLSIAQQPFPDAHDQAPPDWSGDEPFRLSQSYPKTEPVKGDAPWSHFDFTKEREAYMRAVLSYAYEGNAANDWRVEKNTVRRWYHAPWMHWGDKGREFIHGLTRERRSRPCELSETQTMPFQNWAVSIYNDLGGYVLGQVWEKPWSPNPAAADFPPGTVSVKLLFTQATPDIVPFLKGAPEWNAHILTSPDSTVRGVQTLRLLQIDIAVRDERADDSTGWVFGTFQYDAGVEDPDPWNRVTPIALMWGNKVKPPQFWINRDAPFVRYRDSVKGTLGWEGRPNGPVDSQESSCLSCHSTSQYPANADLVPPSNVADKSPWFRNLKTGEAFGQHAQSLHYSLQLAAGSRTFSNGWPWSKASVPGDPFQAHRRPRFHRRRSLRKNAHSRERSSPGAKRS